MVRAEPTNNRTAGIDTNHSTVFKLPLELNALCEERWSQFEMQNNPCRVFAFDFKIYTTILQSCETKFFDIFRMLTSKQKFPQSNPVLIRQFWKKLPSDLVLIRPKLTSVLIQSDPVLIRAHLWYAAEVSINRIRIGYPAGYLRFFQIRIGIGCLFLKKIGSGQEQDICFISITKFPSEWFKVSQMMVVVL